MDTEKIAVDHTPATAKKRTALQAKGFLLLVLSYQTLGKWRIDACRTIPHNYPGIIYSDVGTSPLYVLNGIWPASGPVPSKEDVIGGISAVVWALTLIPLIKYVRPNPSSLDNPRLTLALPGLHLVVLWDEGGRGGLFRSLPRSLSRCREGF